MRYLLGTLALCICTFSVIAQTDTTDAYAKKDLVDVYRSFVGKKAFSETEQAQRDSNKLYFSLLPAFGTSSNSKGFVTSFMTAFYLGDKNTTNLSTIYFTPYFTFSNQWVLPIRSYIWTRNNQFSFTGDYRFMKYPQEIFELGAPSSSTAQSLLDYYQVRFYQDVTRRIFKRKVTAGVGIQLDHYYDINQKKKYIEGPTDWETYGDSGLTNYTSVGPSFNLIYDVRGNTINPEKGAVLRVTYRDNLTAFGSTKNWSSVYVDARKYFRLSKQAHRVFGLWGLYWTVASGKAQYLDLPSIGWDYFGRTGRGIERNRYRSTSILYAEAEYRTDITRNGLWGAVVFANMTSPAVMYTQRYTHYYGAAGTGVRLKFDKRSGSNIVFDVGFSKDYWTWYLALNEYF